MLDFLSYKAKPEAYLSLYWSPNYSYAACVQLSLEFKKYYYTVYSFFTGFKFLLKRALIEEICVQNISMQPYFKLLGCHKVLECDWLPSC